MRNDRDRSVSAAERDEASLPVNPALVWDYDVPTEAEQNEAFRTWYIARVLTRGRADDIKALGLSTICRYLPRLKLPAKIRSFWEWYLSFPDVRERHGCPDPAPVQGPRGHRKQPAQG